MIAVRAWLLVQIKIKNSQARNRGTKEPQIIRCTPAVNIGDKFDIAFLFVLPCKRTKKNPKRTTNNLLDYQKEDKTPELAKIKTENLQKVSTKYSNQNRQKRD